jgi:hypothetical protein
MLRDLTIDNIDFRAGPAALGAVVPSPPSKINAIARVSAGNSRSETRAQILPGCRKIAPANCSARLPFEQLSRWTLWFRSETAGPRADEVISASANSRRYRGVTYPSRRLTLSIKRSIANGLRM